LRDFLVEDQRFPVTKSWKPFDPKRPFVVLDESLAFPLRLFGLPWSVA
jgi:hypothetical protein